ncbi:MAG: 6-bladed beta-propeller [Balneolaceae bacterium]|nr:MAG: 6-bladed beta-propeller [Balneolaceae bacterium]
MSQELEELPVAASKVIEVSSVYNPGQGIGWSNEYLIVADNARNSLVLLHIDGAEISSTGRRGKGPGEFEVINQLHKGSDGFLYVLDRMQVRVSQFMIENDEIRYIHSFSPDTPDQKLLQEVYITESGFYALYNRTVNYATGENSYYLYRTDKQFNPKELLFEMDGGEQISLEPVGFVEHPLASQTLWSQNGNKFYILDSHHTTLQKINLENGDVSSFTIIKETDRPNSSNSRSYLEERLEPVIRLIPAMNDAIQESKKLPLHHSFFVTNGWTVISTYYAGSANGIVLLHEEGSPEVVYARVLPHFYPFAMSGKQLIGLNRPSQDQAEIKVLTLDW